MMAALFLIYLICFLLMGLKRPHMAFGLILINFILATILFLSHSTEGLGIRL
jgi:hypothetical protein